ncbi:MAG: DUF2795 domain-containing protein [Actinomycetota bacterium]|nr:DUF2795 domain-containing protein [Actinomycetota bacterium]
MDDDFRASAPAALHAVLTGMEPPVTTSELLERARLAGAGPREIATLERLPERSWASVDQAVAAATAAWPPDTAP